MSAEQDGLDPAKVSEPQVLRSLPVDICTACIRGAGGECHTPGCMFWTCPAPTPEQAQRFQQQATTGRAGRSMAERQRDGARARADVLERQAEDFYARLIEVLNPDNDELEPSGVVDLVRDLTALALDLQGKVARVEALLGEPPVPVYDADNPNCPGSFEGHAAGRRQDHRTVGTHRAWSDAGEWCYPDAPCSWCQPHVDPADVRDALADKPEQVQP